MIHNFPLAFAILGLDNRIWEGVFNWDDDQLTEEECEVCKELSGVRLEDVSQDLMASEYLVDEIPVIITDATRDWPMALDRFDLNTLKEVRMFIVVHFYKIHVT